MTNAPHDRRPDGDSGATRMTTGTTGGTGTGSTAGITGTGGTTTPSYPTVSPGTAVARQHDAFGGIKWGSAFFGWLSANGLAVILLALATAGGTAFGLTRVNNATQAANAATSNAGTIGLVGGIVLLAILMLAYFAGGYVAGRMSRFDGLRQGLAVWIIGLLAVLLAAGIAAVAGTQYNVFASLNLPSLPVGQDTLTTAGWIALASVLVGTLVAAILGGKVGERYHRKVDRAGFDH